MLGWHDVGATATPVACGARPVYAFRNVDSGGGIVGPLATVHHCRDHEDDRILDLVAGSARCLQCRSALGHRQCCRVGGDGRQEVDLLQVPCLEHGEFATTVDWTRREFLVILATMTTTLPLGEVKAHLSELVRRVHDHHERVAVTVHGRPSAVLVAVEDLERLEETLAILSDPATMRRLAESDAELARGEVVSSEELAEVMRRRAATGR
jgi:prevent-host-death family protein